MKVSSLNPITCRNSLIIYFDEKIAISILLTFTVIISHATDTCKIILNKKDVLEVKGKIIASIVFENDSIYQLRSEKEAYKWISDGRCEVQNKKFFLLPFS